MLSDSLIQIQFQIHESWLRADLEMCQFIPTIHPFIHPSIHPSILPPTLPRSLTESLLCISHQDSAKGAQHCEGSPCLQNLKKQEGLKTTQEFQAKFVQSLEKADQNVP